MLKFEVVKIEFDSMNEALKRFYFDCGQEGIINNQSEKAMKISQFSQQAWWGAIVDGRIVAISGCYRSDDFGENSWRVLFRSATLKEFRGRAGPFSRFLNHDFTWGHFLNIQKDYARTRGARCLFFTTNSDASGYAGSLRVNRFVERVLFPAGRVKLIQRDLEYGFCRQNIWEVL
jgi:hypothetical protein